VRPVLLFAAPFLFLIALLSTMLSPWATAKSEEFRRILESREDVAAISPGVFKESRHADRVFFVERLTLDLSVVANIFVHSAEGGEIGTTVAQRGYQETAPNGDRFLVLEKGRRYVGPPGSAEYKIIEFEKYAFRIEPREMREYVPSVKSLPTEQLLRTRTPQTQAEFIWRAGLPLSAFVLCLLAIPLSFVNPRAGRSLNLILAALAYLVYSNLLSIMQAWVAQERVPYAVGMWGMHAVMLALVGLLMYWRLSVFTFRRLAR
jgi:lipopolysaccharide export system permease protein